MQLPFAALPQLCALYVAIPLPPLAKGALSILWHVRAALGKNNLAITALLFLFNHARPWCFCFGASFQRPSIDVSDLSPAAAAGFLKELPRVAAAVKRASGAPAVKVVSNAGAAAGQVWWCAIRAFFKPLPEPASFVALLPARLFSTLIFMSSRASTKATPWMARAQW